MQDSATTAGAFGLVTMGIILVTAKALAIGVTGIPNPNTDVGSDWIWWDVGTWGEETSSSVIGRPISVDRLVIDSKAMRKVGLNMALVFVAQAIACEGTVSANICGAVRILLKST